MQKPICPYCKSEDVTIESDCSWDFTKQEWVLAGIFENCYCRDCEETIKHLEWVDTPDETSKPVIQHPV